VSPALVSLAIIATQVSHFDVFERFFAADYARFNQEARAANSTRGIEDWVVSTGPSCTDAANEIRDAIVFQDPYFALGQDAFGESAAFSSFMGTCRVPDEAKVEICVAVKDGVVRGSTVIVAGASEDDAKCIDRGVRQLSFPMTRAR